MSIALARKAQPIYPIVALVVAGIAAWASFFYPILALLLFGLAAVLLLELQPWLAIPLLILAATLDRIGLHAADAAIRIDLVMAALVGAVVINRLAVRSLPAGRLRSGMLLAFLGYVAANFFSTLVFAHERARGLKLDLQILAVFLAFLAVIVFLSTRGDLERAVKFLWVVTVAEAAIAIVAIVAYAAHVSSFGAGTGDLGYPEAFGTQWEGNILGSFLLGNFFVLLGDYFRSGRSAMHALGLFVVLIGVAVSMTRTVWLALLIGVLLFALLARRKIGTKPVLPLVGAFISIFALGAIALGSVTPFGPRLLDLTNLQTSSAVGRIALFSAGIADWKHHLLFGMGTGSFNFGATPGLPHPWLPNLFLLTLHDTGIIGAACLLLMIVFFWRTCWIALFQRNELAWLIRGSLVGFTALILTFQTTSGFWFVYPWIVAGLGIASARISRSSA